MGIFFLNRTYNYLRYKCSRNRYTKRDAPDNMFSSEKKVNLWFWWNIYACGKMFRYHGVSRGPLSLPPQIASPPSILIVPFSTRRSTGWSRIWTRVQGARQSGTSADVSGLYDGRVQQRHCVQLGENVGAGSTVPERRRPGAVVLGTGSDLQQGCHLRNYILYILNYISRSVFFFFFRFCV